MNYTRGPLTVEIEQCFPFDIVTLNSQGGVEFRRRMPAHSTRQACAEQCMAGMYMKSYQEDAVLLNARAVADERLRAAAPELLEALRIAVRQNSHDMLMTGEELRLCEAAIAKCNAPTGE